MTEGKDNPEDSAAPLIEHLTELRQRLIYSVSAFTVAMLACFTIWKPIFNFLTLPLCASMIQRGHQDCGLILIKLQEGFFVAISISLMGGLIIAFPIIGYQMWRFVAPGLYKSEKGAFLPFILASPIMFFLGASFAYFVVTPLAFDFFLGFQQPGSLGSGEASEAETAGIAFQGSAQEYLNLTIKFIVAFGVCFQLPVLLTLMGKAGLVSSAGLKNVRKFAIVGILVLAALVTPPDVITQIILFVVVYGLYEISIFLVARVEKKINEDILDDDYSSDLNDDSADPLIKDFDEKEFYVNVENVIDEMNVEISEPLLFENCVFDDSLNEYVIFIYGQRVDNFKSLDKNAIWTVVAAATQEIDRQQQADKVRIAELETKVETLESQLANVLARLTALENA